MRFGPEMSPLVPRTFCDRPTRCLPARERGEIDCDTANWLATENKDFLEYVKRFYQTGKTRLGKR